MKKVSIFIPYKKQGDGEELRFVLRSIEKNCKFDYEILLVGDCPDWIEKEMVTHINPHIPATAEFPKAWNVIEKLKFVLENHNIDKLLLVYDDTIFLKGVDYKDINKVIALAQLPTSAAELDGTSSEKWKEIMQNTIKALKRNKLPMLNFETHLPRLFDAKKLSELLAHFGFKKRPYMFSTLYFNWVKPNGKPVILAELPDQKLKAGIYFDGDFEKYSPVLEDYTFLNWAEKQWSQELENVLFGLFPEPSVFEIPATIPDNTPDETPDTTSDIT